MSALPFPTDAAPLQRASEPGPRPPKGNSPGGRPSFERRPAKDAAPLPAPQTFSFAGPSLRDAGFFGQRASKWAPGKRLFPRGPVRSSKNTLKLLRDLHGEAGPRPGAAREKQFRGVLSPRRDTARAGVEILESVSPIVLKKTRGSRTSVKRMILEPQASERDFQEPAAPAEPGREGRAPRPSLGFRVRESKRLPTEFYNEILLGASLLSNPREAEAPPEGPGLGLAEGLRRSVELPQPSQASRPSSPRSSRHASLRQSHFSRNTSQSQARAEPKALSRPILGFRAGRAGSSGLLPGTKIPTIDLFQSGERNSRRPTLSNCDSGTSVVSRGSSSFKLVKRELKVSTQMARKKKTRLSHDLRAFKVVAEPLEEGEGAPGPSGESEGAEEGPGAQREAEAGALSRASFPKLFALEQEAAREREGAANVFQGGPGGAESPFKLRNEKSQAIYESLSKDLQEVLSQKCGRRLKRVRSKSNSLKGASRDLQASAFEQKGIMTFRKRESARSSFGGPAKEARRSREALEEVHISYLNSTAFDSRAENARGTPFAGRAGRIDRLESALHSLKQTKGLAALRRKQQMKRLQRHWSGATPPKQRTPLKPRKSRSPLHLAPGPAFAPAARARKNYSQRYIQTFRRGRRAQKENPPEPRAKGFCSIKYAALELKSQQRKLEHMLESCQNTFKQLDWNLSNLEEARALQERRTAGYRRPGGRPEAGFGRRHGSALRARRPRERLSSRKRINELYKDFCKTLDFGRGARAKGPEKTSKLMRINLIKKKLDRL